MVNSRTTLALVGFVVLSGLTAIAFTTRDHWLEWLMPKETAKAAEEQVAPAVEPKMLKLTEQARKNLALVSKLVALQTYWRTGQIPGVIVDRPGQSDRGVTAPAIGVITKVHAFPGDTVKAGDRLLTLRLISEYLQNIQSELFKTTREVQLVQEQRDRLKAVAQSIPESRIIDLENQLRRLNATIQSNRQDLLARGLSPAHLDSVAAGKFITEIDVVAPRPTTDNAHLVNPNVLPPGLVPAATDSRPDYEVQELKVELGQQVQVGQLLSLLANHQTLYIEGHSFKREGPLLEQAARNAWPVRVEFSEDDPAHWPQIGQTFTIRHLANAVDPASRTFSFYLPLANQSRAYQRDGHTFLVWRFQPGQRVRLHVPVQEFGKSDGKDAEKVIVLPAAAVVREGPEAYVFRQDGDLFERHPVHVVYEDRLNVVLANDGTLRPGIDYVAQGAAAALNRVLKAQNSGGGLPPGGHFHADGSLHIPGK